MTRTSASEQVRWLVEERQRAAHDWASRLEDARLTGLEEGGRRALLEMAGRMREEGLAPEAIARLTGLRPQDLEA